MKKYILTYLLVFLLAFSLLRKRKHAKLIFITTHKLLFSCLFSLSFQKDGIFTEWYPLAESYQKLISIVKGLWLMKVLKSKQVSPYPTPHCVGLCKPCSESLQYLKQFLDESLSPSDYWQG